MQGVPWWMGWTKARWGQVFLATALLAGFAFVLWRWRRDCRGLPLFTSLCLLAFVMLPTTVHERYVILTLPFIGVAAALSWRFWPGLLLLIVVTTAQVSWPLWLRPAAGDLVQYRAQAERDYQQARARAAIDPKRTVPSAATIMQLYEAQYRADHAKCAPWEWRYTVAALLGTALTGWAVVTLRQPDRPTPGRTARATPHEVAART